MAEVPPHLLERSRSRRAALGLGGDDAVAAVPAVVTTATAAPASAVAALATGGGAPPPPTPPKAVRPHRPRRPAIPRFALPMLLLLPVWAISYVSVFAAQKEKLVGPEAVGTAVYSVNCSRCHQPDGSGSDSGGVGRPLWKGEAEKTFVSDAEQIAFVKRGSYAVGTPYGNPKREGGQHQAKGGMPKWEGALTDDEIKAVIEYERSVLQGKPFPVDTVAPGAAPAKK